MLIKNFYYDYLTRFKEAVIEQDNKIYKWYEDLEEKY